MEYNDLINELLDLISENEDVKKLKKIKEELLLDKKLQAEINNYRLSKTLDNKKKLFLNSKYLEYLKSENEINLLIEDIKRKFKIFSNRVCHNANN